MASVNLFRSNLTGKELRTEKSETKKAINAALRDFEKAIEGAFNAVVKSEDRRARNVANAAKGKYRTAIAVVQNCFPYQTEAGVLCAKKKDEDEVYRWQVKKLTAAAARGIVRDSLKNFTNFVGAPEITIVKVGATIEK